MTPVPLTLQGAAAAASLLGYLLIARGGLLGSGTAISPTQGLSLLTIALLYGWWPSAVAAATSGVRGALAALVVIDVVWVALGQGLAGFFFCAFPVCPEAAPFTDIARYGSLLLGIAAAWTAWRAYRSMRGPTQPAPIVTALLLIVLSFALQGAA